METILRCKSNLLVEIEQRHLGSTNIAEIFGWITGLEYEGSFILNGSELLISEFDVEKHQIRLIDELEAKGRVNVYINSFIFRPDPK